MRPIKKVVWLRQPSVSLLAEVIGASIAPEDERPELHAMYWGGIVGVMAAVAANYCFSDERDNGNPAP